jgi:hypothetical protein
MVDEKSDAVPPGLASVNVATWPENGDPGTACTLVEWR